jgi:hypothetical protein
VAWGRSGRRAALSLCERTMRFTKIPERNEIFCKTIGKIICKTDEQDAARLRPCRRSLNNSAESPIFS